jgi:hypothetical protein
VKKYLSVSIVCFLMTASAVERQRLTFRIAFGYKDARPARFVSDLYEKVQIIQRLLQPCREKNQHVCDFARAKDDGDLLYRKLRTNKGYQLVVSLRVTASSASPDDDSNRRDRFQDYLSQASEQNFFSGIRRGEATFYVGHSRDGGGPDFSPPRLKHDQHIDYAWYQKAQPGLRKLRAALKGRPLDSKRSRKQILGLFSCRSTQLFARSVHRSGRQVELVSATDLVYYTEGLDMVEKALSRFISEAL